MSSVAPIFLPDQDMGNATSIEIPRAQNIAHRYHPYVVPLLAEAPWVAPTSDRTNAIARLCENTRDKRKRNRKEIRYQRWITYQIRFITASHLCNAFDTFGGIAPQFNHLDIRPNMSIAESVATAISYDRLVKTHLQTSDRWRGQSIGFALLLLKKRNQDPKRKAIAENTSPPDSPCDG